MGFVSGDWVVFFRFWVRGYYCCLCYLKFVESRDFTVFGVILVGSGEVLR